MLSEHEPQASVSTAFSSSPKLSRVCLTGLHLSVSNSPNPSRGYIKNVFYCLNGNWSKRCGQTRLSANCMQISFLCNVKHVIFVYGGDFGQKWLIL